MPQLRWSALRLILIAGLALATLAAGWAPTRVEYALLDLRFAINRAFEHQTERAYASRVAVLLVTPDSERRLDEIYSTEWRTWYPQLVRTVSESGARGIVWDATFLASRPEYDEQLAQAFTGFPVVAAENAVERNNETIRPALAGVGWKRFVVVRNVPRRTTGETPLPPLGAVARRLVAETPSPAEQLPAPSIWLDFSWSPLSVPAFDIADVILGSSERLADPGRTPTSILTDRVVFIGTDLPGADRYPIPGTRDRSVAGVLAQVASLWSYLSPRRIARVDGWSARAIVFLPAAAVILVSGLRRRRRRRVGTAIIGGVVLLLPPIAFATLRLWLPYAAMILLTAAAVAIVAAAHRVQLARSYRTSLGFDPHLLEDHWGSVQSYSTGVERTTTVLCADVRNYTQFVTDSLPDEVQKVMTTYMAEMERIVHQHGGYINKFVGDEIIAVFGFPLSEHDASQRSVLTARDMLAQVHELNARWSVENLPVLDGIGIGVDTGPVRFTNIGGSQRVQFDVIGGAINGASRLQGLTKQMGHALIISAEVAREQTVFAVGEAGENAFADEPALEFIGEVMVRGQGRRRLFGAAGQIVEGGLS